jgi:hypothetical protein
VSDAFDELCLALHHLSGIGHHCGGRTCRLCRSGRPACVLSGRGCACSHGRSCSAVADLWRLGPGSQSLEPDLHFPDAETTSPSQRILTFSYTARKSQLWKRNPQGDTAAALTRHLRPRLYEHELMNPHPAFGTPSGPGGRGERCEERLPCCDCQVARPHGAQRVPPAPDESGPSRNDSTSASRAISSRVVICLTVKREFSGYRLCNFS